MRNKSAILGILGMAAMMSGESYPVTERGNVGRTKPDIEPKPPKEPTPFKEQEGVKKMIDDYKLIKSGKSKKGKLKQQRIVEKVEKWIKSKKMHQNDLI